MSTPASFSRLSESKQAILQQRLRAARSSAAKPQTIPRAPRTSLLPLAYIQQQMWFLEQLMPGNPAYTVFEAVRLRGGPLQVAALERSFEQTIRRYEILRTRFRLDGERPVQTVSAPEPFRLAIDDLRHLNSEEREREAQRLAKIESQRPFDLQNDLMIRARLLRMAENDHVLLVNMHHIAADGWSQGILYRELSEFYRAETEARPAQLADLPIQFADYAAWQRSSLHSEGIQKQIAYWKAKFAIPVEPLRLPSDRPRPNRPTFRGAQEWFQVPAPIIEKARALARTENATLFMVLAAVFKLLLFRYTQQSDIVIGTTVTGRKYWETEGLIGPFINAIPLRSDLSGNPAFRGFVQQIRETTLDAYANQDVPLEVLVQDLKLKRDVSHLPLFQVMLNLQNVPTHNFEVPGFESERAEVDNGTAKFDLMVYMTETPGGLQVMCEYSTDLFEPETIRRMNRHFERILSSAVENPDVKVSELEMLVAGEGPLQLARQEAVKEETLPAEEETQTTKVLRGIWTEVLRRPEIGLNDNFFDLGGHSILAIQVMARVNDTFQCDMAVGHLFEAPTIASLATVIEQTLLEEIEGLSDAEAEQMKAEVSGVTS